MNQKVEKLREERAKNVAKIERLTARNKVIDEKVTGLENSDIVGLVREQGLTPDELAKLLAAMQTSPMPLGNTKMHKEDAHEEEEI